MKQSDLIKNIDKIHSTKLGIDRISKNLNIDKKQSIKYCVDIVKNNKTNIYKKGKNWYCEYDKIIITINSKTYTIITAHIIK